MGDAVRGHSEAIGDWIAGAAETAQKSAQAQADAISTAKREKTRVRYDGLSLAELTDLLTDRDLPKTGMNDGLVARLVEADTR